MRASTDDPKIYVIVPRPDDVHEIYVFPDTAWGLARCREFRLMLADAHRLSHVATRMIEVEEEPRKPSKPKPSSGSPIKKKP